MKEGLFSSAVEVHPSDWLEKIRKNPCQKQTVIAFLINWDKITKKLKIFIGSNWCKTPVEVGECPRVKQGYASGEGYYLCKEVCTQPAHAEIDACKEAGNLAKNSTVFVTGHTRICEDCAKVMKKYGVRRWILI